MTFRAIYNQEVGFEVKFESVKKCCQYFKKVMIENRLKDSEYDIYYQGKPVGKVWRNWTSHVKYTCENI